MAIYITLLGKRLSISMIISKLRAMWDMWDVNFVILLSLFLQLILIFFGLSRKRVKGASRVFIWLAYLLAEWAATYSIGLISRSSKATEITRYHLFAFWSPFLLLHLGGPDTITAYALADNELWLRHLLQLIFQTITALYIFILAFDEKNPYFIPSFLVLVAGLIKYAERTRALYKASFNSFRQSLVPDPGPDYGKLMEELYSQRRVGIPSRMISVTHQDDTTSSLPVATQGFDVEDIEQLELVQKGFHFFKKFKGVIVDMIFTFDDRRESRDYFTSKEPEQVLQVLEIELNFMYEAFYTKVNITRTLFGCFFKLVSFTCVFFALVLFLLEEKHDFYGFDIGVTYALLYGALALEVVALFMLFVTEYTAILPRILEDEYLHTTSDFQRIKTRLFIYMLNILNKNFLVLFFRAKKPVWVEIVDENSRYKGYHKLQTNLCFRRWFGKIPGYNLMRYCLEKSVKKDVYIPCDENIPSCIKKFIQGGYSKIVLPVKKGINSVAKTCGFDELMDHCMFTDYDGPFLKELWEFIFIELKMRSDAVDENDAEKIQDMCSVRGEWTIGKELDDGSREKLNCFVAGNKVSFDQSLILWHLATCLCYYSEKKCDVQDPKCREYRAFSMILSDYLMYLLMVQPMLMSSVAGIGQIRFFATYQEAKRFFRRREQLEKIRLPKERLEKACLDIMEVLEGVNEEGSTDSQWESSISLLFEACKLAKVLNSDGLNEKKWKIIASVWVELLSFCAAQCRPTAHVKLLSEGGELISLVWLLMIHLGLGNFQYRDPAAKLLLKP